MSCHIRFASDNAKFGQPEVNLGILPGYGGTQRLPRLIGVAKAIELTISGNMIGAEEAKSIGLVNQVYSQAELMEKTLEFANTVLSKGSIAVSASIDAIYQSLNLSPIEGLAYESKLFGEVCGTEDFKEGTSAFLEKRKPNFKN
jgi:enoyl-CoA hydratase